MKPFRILLMGVMIMLATVGCVRPFCCGKKNARAEVKDTLDNATPQLPHDYPPELVPPQSTFTHGATGMMRAEANPESNAHFVTYEPWDSILDFFRSVKGFQMRFEGLDSAGVYTIALEQVAELSDFQFIAELVPPKDEEDKPLIHIDVVYGSGIRIRYPQYFKEFEPPDESFPHQ